MRLATTVRSAVIRPGRIRFARAVAPTLAPTVRTPGGSGAPWLDSHVYIALGADLSQPPTAWGWADITNYVRFASGISTTQGRPDESQTVRTSSASLTLDNTDGRFSRKNPNGAYYGLLSRNTPIWGTIDAGTGAKTRLAQFVNEWPSRWDPSQADATVPIQCAGIMRRLAQGGDPKSAMRRSQGAASPSAWWPLEEGKLSTVGASGLAGGTATFALTAPAKFGASPIGLSGAAAGVDFSSGGSLVAPTGQPLAAAPNGWEWECVVAFDEVPTVSPGTLRSIIHSTSSGPAAVMGVGIMNAAGITSFANYIFDTAGSGSFSFASLTFPPAPLQAGRTYHIRGRGHQEGIAFRFTVDVDGVPGFDSGGNGTLMMPTTISMNVSYDPAGPTNLANVPFLSSLAFWAPFRTSATTFNAGNGWAGESAVARIVRVCQEDRVPLVCTAATAPSPAMGAQPVATLLEVLADAEQVDQGVLYETNWGLGYQSLFERVNQAPGLALDMNLGQLAAPPEPADDDQRLRNRWRATRTSGSVEAVAELTTGPLGTGAGGPGLYDDSVTVNVQSDSQLPDQAGWRLHRDTFDEDRWPSLAIALHNIPAFIGTWTALPWGARMTVAHPPGQMAPETIDAIIEGWNESWDQIFWNATIATAPYSSFDVRTLASDTVPATTDGRDDWDTCTVAVDSGATMTVNVSPLITTAAADFPFDVMCEGERITVTNCSGSSSPQTLTVTRSVNGIVKTHAAGASVVLLGATILTM